MAQTKTEEKAAVAKEAKAEKPAAEKAAPAQAKAPAAKKEKAAKAAPKREFVLERVHTFNLMDAYGKPRYRRADAAMRMLRELLARHMKADVRDVRLSPQVNEFVRARGNTYPVKRVKVKASKDKEGMVLAVLAQ